MKSDHQLMITASKDLVESNNTACTTAKSRAKVCNTYTSSRLKRTLMQAPALATRVHKRCFRRNWSDTSKGSLSAPKEALRVRLSQIRFGLAKHFKIGLFRIRFSRVLGAFNTIISIGLLNSIILSPFRSKLSLMCQHVIQMDEDKLSSQILR